MPIAIRRVGATCTRAGSNSTTRQEAEHGVLCRVGHWSGADATHHHQAISVDCPLRDPPYDLGRSRPRVGSLFRLANRNRWPAKSRELPSLSRLGPAKRGLESATAKGHRTKGRSGRSVGHGTAREEAWHPNRIALPFFYLGRHLGSVSVAAAEKRRRPRSNRLADRTLSVGAVLPLRSTRNGQRAARGGERGSERSMVGGGGKGTLVGRRLRLDLPYIWTLGQSLVVLFVGQSPSKSVKTKPISCQHKMHSHNSLDAVSGPAGSPKRTQYFMVSSQSGEPAPPEGGFTAPSSALGLPCGQPEPPNRLSPSWATTEHGGVQ